jgi:hypothetical protein
MIPEAATEGNQHVLIKSSTSFDDAIELMHETIGCIGVERKPTLAYKFSMANKSASTINLRTEDDQWEGLVTDVHAKTKKDISINISVLPENVRIPLICFSTISNLPVHGFFACEEQKEGAGDQER